MIKLVEGNLLNKKLDILMHQANCFHSMNAGIALQLKKRYKEVEEADLKTQYGKSKLGTYSIAKTPNYLVLNCYSQENLTTRIDKLEIIIDSVIKEFGNEKLVVGIPYNYGCGISRGNWSEIENIFINKFNKSKLDLIICKFKKVI